jgi:hypothetical protein
MRFAYFASVAAALCCSVSAKFSADALADKVKAITNSITIETQDFTEELVDTVQEKIYAIQDRLDDINEIDTNSILKALHLDESNSGSIGVRNVTCISTWCGSKLAACSLDQNCRDNMNCAKACGSDNSTCTFLCSESYQSKAVDNLMRCMFVDHKCLYLPDPDPINNAACRNPAQLTVGTIDHAKLTGTWKVNYGFNPDYDCFACQELSFNFNNTDAKNPIWYNAYYDIINVKGNLQWNDVVMTGSEAKGILALAG